MATQVKVINEGSEPYVDTYNGKAINIPVKGYILMQRREAIKFLGQMSPPDRHDKSRPAEKKLRMVVVDKNAKKSKQEDTPEMFICNLDGRKFNTQEELDAHLATLSDKVAVKDETGTIKRKVA